MAKKLNADKKWKIFAAVIAVVLCILIGVLVFLIVKKLTAFDAKKVYKEYTELNEQLIDIEDGYSKDGFVAKDDVEALLDEVESTLKDLKEDKEIADYERYELNVSVKLNSGVGYIYAPPVEDVMSSGNGTNTIVTIEPYATDATFVTNYLFWGASPDDCARTVESELSDTYSFPKENNVDSFSFESTIDKMINNKIIIWYGHGGYCDVGPVLATGILITEDLSQFKAELRKGEVYLSSKDYCVSPLYFKNKLPDGSLDGSMVYLAACNTGRDGRLAQVLIDKGADLVVGNSLPISHGYLLNMMEDFFTALTYKYDSGRYWTAEDALAYAKGENGAKDDEFLFYGAELLLYYPTNDSYYSLDKPDDSNVEVPNVDGSTNPNNPDSPSNEQNPAPPNNMGSKLSDTCDVVLCEATVNGNHYELVANQHDAYPDTTFEFGVIKNNQWLLPMSTNNAVLNNGHWVGTEYNTLNTVSFRHVGDSVFLYRNNKLYDVETGVTIDNVFLFDGYISNNKEFIMKSYEPGYNQTILLYCNTLTGESKKLEGYFSSVHTPDAIQEYNEGLFYATGKTFEWENYEYVRYAGFFDRYGNMVIDLSDYIIITYQGEQDLRFVNGTCTIRCKNNSNVDFDITIDKTGNIIKQEQVIY